jgi:hypothetical protein
MIYIGYLFPVKTIWYALPPWTARRVLGSTCRRTPPKRNCRRALFFGLTNVTGGCPLCRVWGKRWDHYPRYINDGGGWIGSVKKFPERNMLFVHWSRRVCTSCDRLIVDTTRFCDPCLYFAKSNSKLVQSRLLLLHYISHLR